MSDTRSFKELELKVHEELYNNLCLLKYFYKTTSEFDRAFKKFMFIRNNKSAFYEVVYYLLHILNPQLTKKRLTSWPPFEIKGENKFRSELLKYINELNVIYKYANIPPIMSSHLISPGGFKFTRFMLKLSQLVMHEHLSKKHNKDLLYCSELNKNLEETKRIIYNYNKITLDIEYKTSEKLCEFQEFCNNQQEKALLLVNALKQLDKIISSSKKEQNLEEEEFYKKYTVYPSMQSLRQKLITSKQQWYNLIQIHKLFEDCKILLHYLKTNNLAIDLLDVTDKIYNNLTSQEGLMNLSKFLDMFTSLINRQSLELPNPSGCYIKQNSENVLSLTEKYEQVEKDILIGKQQTQLLIKDMFDSLKLSESLIVKQIKNNSDMDFLDDLQGIQPLEDSSSE